MTSILEAPAALNTLKKARYQAIFYVGLQFLNDIFNSNVQIREDEILKKYQLDREQKLFFVGV